MIATDYLKPAKFCLALGAMFLLPCGMSSATVLFSYDASTGQLPTEQGWLGWHIATDGPLTPPTPDTSTSATHSNVAIVDVEGESVLHLRATLTDTDYLLPTFYYQWTSAQQQALIDHGLKFTMEFRGFQTSVGGKGNLRFDFSGGEFDVFTNIGANQALNIVGLSSELRSQDGNFRTLEVIGEQVGTEFVFTGTLDGEPLGEFFPSGIGHTIVNSPNVNFVNSIYFGHSTGNAAQRGTDIQVKSIVMETLTPIPEPTSILLAACGGLIVLHCGRSRRRST